MDIILYYIRDHLVGTHYFIYAFILLFFMFSIIGYLFKQKYAKFDIKLATSQDSAKKIKKDKKLFTSKKELKNIIDNNNIQQTIKPTTIVSQNINNNKKIITDVQNVNEVNIKQEEVVAKPMPNVESSNELTPTPMPNVGITNQNPTELSVNPNLSAAIPEIK